MKTETMLLLAVAGIGAWWWWSKQKAAAAPPAVAPTLPGNEAFAAPGNLRLPSGYTGGAITTLEARGPGGGFTTLEARGAPGALVPLVGGWRIPSYTDASCNCPPGKHNVGIGGCVCA